MTEKRLAHISVMSASLHGLIVSFVLAYPAVAFMRFLQGFDPRHQGFDDHTGWWWVVWIVVPLSIAVLGAIITGLSCLVYNVSARLLGGVRYEVEP
jgi:hypothetical protein